MRNLFCVLLTAAVVGATGCAERDVGTPRIKIMPLIATRVTGVHFDAGDCIGLTIEKGSTPYVENRMMTYNGSAFVAEGLLWYNDLNEKSTLTTYYPYTALGVPGQFSVATDQTVDYSQSDLLGARKESVTPGAAPVGMLFRHLLSEVRIVVTNNSDASVTGITVGGSVPAAEADLSTLSVQVQNGVPAAQIKANTVMADAAYRVILVPQQATLTITVQTDDGKSRSKEIASATLVGGKWYDVSVTVTNIDISVTLSGSVEDWGDGGTLGDDNTSTPDPDPAPDDALAYGGVTYRTKTIGDRVWMAENLRFMPALAGLGSGVWMPEGQTPAVAAQGLLYNYATATAGAPAVDLPMQGICPDGWHIPSSEELQTLIGAESGSGFFIYTNYWIASSGESKYGSKSYLMSATCPVGDKCNALRYAEDGSNPVLDVVPVKHGISVRCVKNNR